MHFNFGQFPISVILFNGEKAKLNEKSGARFFLPSVLNQTEPLGWSRAVSSDLFIIIEETFEYISWLSFVCSIGFTPLTAHLKGVCFNDQRLKKGAASKRGFFFMFAKENPKLSDALEKCWKVSQGIMFFFIFPDSDRQIV